MCIGGRLLVRGGQRGRFLRRRNVRLPFVRDVFRATRVFFSYQPRKARLGIGANRRATGKAVS
jgi:hypothetical protein